MASVDARPRTGSLEWVDRVRAGGSYVRGTVAVLLVLAAPLIPGADADEVTRFGLLVAFGWIPLSALASLLAVRRPSIVADAAVLAVDLGLLVLLQVTVDPEVVVVLAGLFVLVAYVTYARGRWAGVAVAVGSTAVVALLDGDLDAFTVVVVPALLAVLAFLLDAVAHDRWTASAGLEAIFTGVGEAIVVTDAAGRVRQWNQAAASTFGCPADEARGRSCQSTLGLLHGVRELDCSNGCALLAVEGSGVDVEVWRRSGTGARQPLLASVSAILDAHGEVSEVVHSYRDITRLKQADEAKTLFLATASHELKTPLTVIRGFSQMLLLPDGIVGDDERAAALRAIDSRATQLTNIVDRLLMSSRIEAGRIELTPVAVDITPVLRERTDALELATNREVVLHIDPALPEVWCDGDAFTTVLDHLLDNAVKYSPNGGPITVAAAGVPGGVEVLVADEGIGMTPEQAAHCFDRFWQAEASDMRRFGGTGIGLYIVRSLVEGMGATISVATAPGTGATFRVELERAGDGERVAGRGEPSMIREYMRQLGLRIEPEPETQQEVVS